MKWGATLGLIFVSSLLTLFLWGCGTDGTDQDARDTEDIPTNFQAQSGTSLGEIELSWSSVEGIDGYMILRTTDLTKPFDTIETYLPDTLYIDTVPADGQRYYYKVISVYGDGSTSFASSVADAVGFYGNVDDTTNTGWPTVVTLTADSGKVVEAINLTWLDAGPGFVYDLYVIRPNITYNNTVYELVASGLTANSYADSLALPSWQTYKLVVRHPQLTGTREATALGYRKITDREFFVEYNNTVFKSQSKLTLMHKSGTGALGTEQFAGDSSGTVGYKATLSPIDAIVTYTNYREFFLTLNGRQYTRITSIFTQDGTVKDSVFVTGIYAGKVNLDLTVDNSKPAGGNYYVTQEGGVQSTISFSSVSSIVNGTNPYK